MGDQIVFGGTRTRRPHYQQTELELLSYLLLFRPTIKNNFSNQFIGNERENICLFNMS